MRSTKSAENTEGTCKASYRSRRLAVSSFRQKPESSGKRQLDKQPYPVDFESIFECLNATGIRYVCVGGIAVVLHGVDRLTADLDLVVELTPESSHKVIEALLTAGFRAKIPADPRGFADLETRRAWIHDKHMQVLSFWDTKRQRPDVDIFVEYPLDFEELYTQSVPTALGRVTCRVASTEHLIQMKQKAGRPKDLNDIVELRERERVRKES